MSTRKSVPPARSGERWTRSEVSQLRQEARDNTETERIATNHQRTESAIRSKASDENISLKPKDKS